MLPGSVPSIPNNTVENNITLATSQTVQAGHLPTETTVAGISEPVQVATEAS